MTKVLVTGALGFVGSNLVERLIEEGGYEIYGIDNLSSPSSDKSYTYPGVKYHLVDLRSYNDMKEAHLPEFDIIFHCAALARIQPSFENPGLSIHNNSVSTLTVLEMARQTKAKVVYAGSSTFHAGPMKNPYAFSKWQGEQMCKMYSEIYDVPTSIVRFFNVYGPRCPKTGDYATVVGIFEELADNDKTLTITGDGTQRRDFTHVDDICQGLIAISKGDHLGEEFNLGNGKNTSINELAEMFGSYKPLNKEYIPARPGEAKDTMADISKAKASGYNPTVELKDYIQSYMEDEIKE